MNFRSSVSRRLFSAGTVLLGLCAAHQAHADDYYVTNTSDSGPGSLRQAIADSNNSVGGDLILFDNRVFGTPQTISAASAYPRFTGETYIIGPDSSLLSLRGPGMGYPGGLFTVDAGANVTIGGLSGSNASIFVANSGTVTIKDCVLTGCPTLINNAAQGLVVALNCDMTHASAYTTTNAGGSDIYNAGSLIARGCALRGSSPNIYGPSSYGLYNTNSATADLGGCTFVGNNSGILDLNSSASTVVDCTFIGGKYDIDNRDTSVATISISTFFLDANSQGLLNRETARVTVTGCAFYPYPGTSRTAPGLYNYGTATITNSTFAGSWIGVRGFSGSTTTITNCTLTQNDYGVYSDGGAVTLRNSLVVGSNYGNVIGTLASGSANNITTGTPAEAGLQVDGNGNAVLNFNGGGTQTFALVNASGTAVDAGNNGFVPSGITTDQRGEGYPRQSGSAVDVGAFEFQAPQPPPSNGGSSASES